MSQVSIIDIEGNHPEIPTQFNADVGFAIPIANVLEILGEYVVAGTVPVQTVGSGNTITTQVQIAQAIAAPNVANIGLAAFDSAFFTVDADGFVSFGGGAGFVESIGVDSATAPGTDPVLPNGSGIITVTGAQVGSGVVGTNVIRTNSISASEYTIEIQRTAAVAGTSVESNGVAHFDSSDFTVNSDGFVSLVGGDAIDSVIVQTGTSPVVPLAGQITINGAVVAAGTNPVRSDGTGANTLAIEVQISQDLAAPDATKIGLSNFDSAAFAVDADGFVSLVGGGTAIESIHPDSGTDPVVPTVAGLVNIIGSGSTTTIGSLNTVTVQLTGLTNHAVLVGAGTTTITKVGPTATVGQVLQSAGAAADPAFSTATYPLTTTINEILYSSAANTVVGLAAANRAVLTSTSAGVPVMTALATDGQLIIGSTAGAPAAATLTAGTGISITNGSNSITIATTGAAVVGATNLGIAYSGGTFTVQGASAALSGTNIAYVTLQSKTAGLLKTIAVTANQTFTDGSGGQIDNMRWGVTTAINWAQDMPFYLYAVLNDAEDTIAFMISRVPHATNSPAAASIGEAGAVVNVGQGDFFSLLNITTTDYNNNPCICLGSFRMQFAGATDSYTVQTLATTDGIGQYNDTTVFNFPVSQNGNATNAYFAANGGTAPIFTTQDAKYQMNRHGEVNYIFDTAGTAPSTNGVGAVTLLMNIPLSYMLQSTRASMFKFINSADTIISIGNAVNPTTAITTLPALRLWNTLSNGYILQNQDVTAAAKFAGLNFNYVANL